MAILAVLGASDGCLAVEAHYQQTPDHLMIILLETHEVGHGKLSQLAGSLPTICQEVMFALLVPRLLISMQQAVTNL